MLTTPLSADVLHAPRHLQSMHACTSQFLQSRHTRMFHVTFEDSWTQKVKKWNGTPELASDNVRQSPLNLKDSSENHHHLRLASGRTEAVRSIRRYQRAQRQGQHTTSCLVAESGVDRKSARQSSLDGRETATSSVKPTLELFLRRQWGKSTHKGVN